MKRSLKLWLGLAAAGLLALVLAPAQAQTPAANTGKIHGRVINPTGQPQGGGTVNLSTDGGVTLKYTFNVDESGNYTGEAPPGTYMVVYRAADTPAGKIVDSVRGIKIVAGEDLEQDIDMSRQEYIDKMTPEEKKALEDLKKQNAQAMQANVLIAQLNADLKIVNQDKKDIDNAPATAAQTLGASAPKVDVANKIVEIRTAKYTDIVSIATKDTALKPDEALLWNQLGYGQLGLAEIDAHAGKASDASAAYDEATTAYKKAVDLETASKKPRMPVIGQAQAGLGEIYARTGKVPEANAAFDAAAKADPANGPLYLKNQAIIFFQENNAPGMSAAADDAIKQDPNPNDPALAIIYYIKGQGLLQQFAASDPKNPAKIILTPDTIAAYQKYLELAPKGQFAGDVTGILQQAGAKPK